MTFCTFEGQQLVAVILLLLLSGSDFGRETAIHIVTEHIEAIKYSRISFSNQGLSKTLSELKMLRVCV